MNNIYNVGRICVKLAGRDAGTRCVILEEVKDNLVLVDGETRRRKVNIKHLEPLSTVVKISVSASHGDVKKVLADIGIEVKDTKPKKSSERPRQKRKIKTDKKSGKKVKKEVKEEKKSEPKAQIKEVVSEKKVEDKIKT